MTYDQLEKKEKIQNRNIDVSSYEYDEDHIVVCGELKDRRLVATHDLAGKPRPPLTVHHLCIELLLSLKERQITRVWVDMKTTPHDECDQIQDKLAVLEGLKIAPGFTRQVNRLLGGRKGCIHLTTLLLAMAPAALQGYWTHADRKPDSRDITHEEMEQYLIDSCHVWRKEGELVKTVADRVVAKK